MKKPKALTVEQKYKLYEASVQNPEFEIEFLVKNFRRFFHKNPEILREDFCGTGMVCCEWVKQGQQFRAVGIDLDPEPIAYGKKHHLSKLNPEQQDRVIYDQRNVLDAEHYKADVIVAFNFSYLIFKKRQELIKYFRSVRKSLNPEGVFFIDILGGPECQTLVEEETEHDNFSYYWDCDKFNPITNECIFHIHFQKNGKKHKNVFTYDWRMWSIPELREALEEAGFSKTHCYWEGEDGEGGGNGEFYITNEAENCESWVTYIAALP
ncbi:MAG: class I SAM-dependent methyltransferase [Bacteriovoracia bacterium]